MKIRNRDRKYAKMFNKRSAGVQIGLTLVLAAAALCLIPVLTAQGPQSISYSSRPLSEITIGPADRDDSGVISVNQSNAEELTAIRGIGPVIAERIISERDQNGFFFYAEDLLAVKGIGESKLKDIRHQIRIETDGGQ